MVATLPISGRYFPYWWSLLSPLVVATLRIDLDGADCQRFDAPRNVALDRVCDHERAKPIEDCALYALLSGLVRFSRQRCPLHRFEQYTMSSHWFFQRARQLKGRSQTGQILLGRSDFLRCAISAARKWASRRRRPRVLVARGETPAISR